MDWIGLVIRNATLIAGTGAAPVADTDIHIVDDRIVAIGTDLDVPGGTRQVDVQGQYVVPGLIDAHVHLMFVPGQDWLDEGIVEDLRREHLRSYVAAGVTTVLDAGTVPETMQEVRGWIADGAPAPTVYWLGYALGPDGGYPSVLESGFGGLSDRASMARAFDEARDFGAIGVKLTFERGFSRRDDLPLFDAEQRTALREEAAERDLPVFVHAMTPSEFVPATDLRPRAFVHGPEFRDREVTAAIAESGAWVVTTLTIYDAALNAGNRRRLADPLLSTVVPEPVLELARDPSSVRRGRRAMAALVVPGVPGWLASLGFTANSVARGKLAKALKAARALHEAGVPLVLGTDSGTWPIIHTQFPGWAAVRELELLAEAGLTPREVLAAGTRLPAELLGIDDEVGTVEVGKVGDLVVLASDPLADPHAWRTITLTVHDGQARSPAEWMRD